MGAEQSRRRAGQLVFICDMIYQLLAVLLAASSAGARVATLTEECLTAHNFYRSLHPGTPPLKWNNRLQREAQIWANELARRDAFEHDNGRTRGYASGETIGENIYQGYKKTCAEAVKLWYDERKLYRYSSPGFAYATGHFTQVIWKETTEVGVAVASRPEGQNTKWWTVARYKPAGNNGYRQDYIDNVLAPNGNRWELSLTDLRKKIAQLTNTDSPFGNCPNVKDEQYCASVNCDAIVRWSEDGYGRRTNTYGYDECPSTCNKCKTGSNKKTPEKKTPEKETKPAPKRGNCKNKYSESYCNDYILKYNKCNEVLGWSSRNGVRTNKYGYTYCPSTCNKCPTKRKKPAPPAPKRSRCEAGPNYCSSVPSWYPCDTPLGTQTVCRNGRCRQFKIYVRDQCKRQCNNCPRGYAMSAADAPVQPSQFFELEAGSECDPEKIITTKEECAAAAKEQYGDDIMDDDENEEFPKGCFYDEENDIVVFNEAVDGKPGSNFAPLCHMVARAQSGDEQEDQERSGEPIKLMAENPSSGEAAAEASSPNTFLVVVMCACVVVAIGSLSVAVVMVRKYKYPSHRAFERLPGENQGLLAANRNDDTVSVNYLK